MADLWGEFMITMHERNYRRAKLDYTVKPQSTLHSRSGDPLASQAFGEGVLGVCCGQGLLHHQRTGGLRGQWPGQEEALHQFAPDVGELPQMLLGLHSFGHGFQAQLLCQAGDRTHRRQVGSRTIQALDE